MNDLKDMSPLGSVMPLCVGDHASDEDKKKGMHDIRYEHTYPPFPWKFDGETDHSKDSAKVFCDIAKQAGIMRNAKQGETKPIEPLLTYSQWVQLHSIDPGWVNNLEGNITK